jgi:hypothetical protein
VQLYDFGTTLPDPYNAFSYSVPVAAWYDTDGVVDRSGKTVVFRDAVFTSTSDGSRVITTILGTITCP